MADSRFKPGYRNLLRFYSFAVPHWRMIVLAVAAMVVYAAVHGLGVLLIKPMFDAFESRQAAVQAGSVVASPAAHPAIPAAGEKAELGLRRPLEGVKQKVSQWLEGLGPIGGAIRWLSPKNDPKKIAFLIAFVVGPLMLISGFLQVYAHRRVVWSIMADVRIAVFDRLSRLSLGYFAGQRTGELVSRLTNDANSAQVALKFLFGRIVLEPMRLLAFLAVAIYSSWHLTALALVTFPPIVFIMGRYGKRIRRYGTKNLERLADVTDSVTQMLSGIRVVKAFNMEKAESEEFRARNRAQLRRAFKLVRSRALAESLPEYFYLLPVALIVIVGDLLVGRGYLNVGTIVQCMVCLILMAGAMRRIVKAYSDMQASMPGVNRIFELVRTQLEIQDSPDAVEIPGVREGIRFNDVWFAYDRQPVLKGISLTAQAGKVYAIVGETGAGKSTMLDMIPRFYDVTKGSVTIDGVDVRQFKRGSLMRQIAIVSQHPFLFNRSIGENIRYGKPDATDQEVIEAARAANIHDFIQSLPEGYQTLAGETGGRLSGGQRQCVTIARAILKDAPILILDEATSSLDAGSEMLIQRALDNLMKNRTTFVIAHRLSTVRHADIIVVLKDGRVIEQGTHDELLRRGGEYERLYRFQFAGGGHKAGSEVDS